MVSNLFIFSNVTVEPISLKGNEIGSMEALGNWGMYDSTVKWHKWNTKGKFRISSELEKELNIPRFIGYAFCFVLLIANTQIMVSWTYPIMYIENIHNIWKGIYYCWVEWHRNKNGGTNQTATYLVKNHLEKRYYTNMQNHTGSFFVGLSIFWNEQETVMNNKFRACRFGCDLQQCSRDPMLYLWWWGATMNMVPVMCRN